MPSKKAHDSTHPLVVTMADVAREADVSRATVSRVLSGSAEVASQRRDRVLAAINELGYVPSSGAQQLAAGRSRSLGLLIRDSRNPTYGLLHAEIQKWADEAGLEIITAMPTYFRGAGQEMDALRRLLGMRVGGLLVATGVVRTADIKQFTSVLPVVSVGRPENDPDVYGVSYDEIGNATQLAHAVHDHGHRRVAVVSPSTEHSLAEHLRGTTSAAVLRDLGCEVVKIDTKLFDDPGEPNPEITDLVRTGRITAVMFSNDLRMLDFVTYARRNGIHVPRDVSVIGCDGVLHGLSYMELASLRVPVETVAQRSIDVMAQLLEAPEKREVLHETYAGEMRLAGSLRRP